MTMNETESLRARAEKAEAERDRLSRVVSVMRGESEHLPDGWSVYLGEPPLCWSRDSAPVGASVDTVTAGSVVTSYKLWVYTIDENGDSDDTVVCTGQCALTLMEEADRRFPVGGGAA
jgi:hypothetical protein